MKKVFIVIINLVVLAFIATTVYRFYINEKNSDIDVDCIIDYSVSLNVMNLTCDIDDEDGVSSTTYPLTLYLYDTNNLLIDSQVLIVGTNSISFDTLDFNSEYNLVVDGYNFNNDDYLLTTFVDFDFSTAKENINIPVINLSELLITDTEFNFEVILTDIDECITSIYIDLYDSSDTLVKTFTYEELLTSEFLITNLLPENDYSIVITTDYIINDFDELAVVQIQNDFITLRTLLTPSVEISNVFTDNVELTFDISYDNKDAVDVVYTMELIDLLGNVLYSEDTTLSNVTIDVNEITDDYYISINASYNFNEVAYENIQLSTYSIYNNAYSNFFILPTVSIVDTSLPLTNYDDYDDYLYTFFNEGLTEFTITCEAPVDCTELVTNINYSRIPFDMTDLVHAYYDINEISYSYSSTEINYTLSMEYSDYDRALVEQEVNSILNSIINETMTDNEKILAVHDYIVNNVVYDDGCLENSLTCDNDHTAIGIFFDYNAVCEGYAHAMDIMLRALHIPTFKVSSDTHQWNAVYIDGAWYHLDATWDDPVTQNGSNVLTHDYYLVTSSELLILDDTDSHTFSTLYINFME